MTAAATPDILIEAYVTEIVRHLPARQRRDVGYELHALLTEDLLARASDARRPVDEAMALDLIGSFGKPDEVASRYADTSAVIIPAEHARGFFWATVVGVGLQWAFSLPAALEKGAGQIGAWWITGGLGALWWPGFLVTVAMIASLIRQRWPAGEWQPRTVDRDRIQRPLFALGLAAALAGVVIWISIASAEATATGPLAAAFAFADGFLVTRGPVVLLYWAAGLALMVVVLIEGRWRKLTRRIGFWLNLGGIALMLWFVLGGPSFTAEKTDVTAKGAMSLVVLLMLVDLVIKLWRARGRIHSPQALPR